ncbi:WecB/TagA/CpsF family glycosyltransferase [Candidatus Parcubacteria bacterium]|nr:WecB/TagA/CpsF family glycosyltransferase [Candidatus Parcubacteria bacterium]
MDRKKSISILGINIDNISKQNLLSRVEKNLEKNNFKFLITPNPEIILQAQKDEEYFYILNKADYSIADGIGLKFAAFLLGKNIKRITGADLSRDILKIAQKKSKKILIINRRKGLSSKKDIEKMLSTGFPGLRYMVVDNPRDKNEWQKIINKKTSDFAPDILFCLFGAPLQEKFIYHNARKIKSIKLALGVGGAFDFLTKKIKRAPYIFRKLGLEWLWRLVKQPKRTKRIYNAVVKFTYKFLRWRFILPFLYRPNVACLLYKYENNKKYILLVERKNDLGHWQLPQGGIDGEDLERAGERELSEELNCNKFKFIKAYKNIYKYKFGQKNETGKYKNARKHIGYKGQKQSLYIAKFTGRDADIKINFWEHRNWQWVEDNKVLDIVHKCRKEATEKYLGLFNKIC